MKEEVRKLAVLIKTGRVQEENVLENENINVSFREDTPPMLPSPIRLPSHSANTSFLSPPLVLPTSAAPVILDCSKENDPPYIIDPAIIKRCRVGCRSRKNLAGKLALAIFTPDERKTSNCRGVRGKKKLDPSRLKAIKLACITEYRPKSSDDKALILKELRISVDEACRRQPKKKIFNDDNDDVNLMDFTQVNENFDMWDSLL